MGNNIADNGTQPALAGLSRLILVAFLATFIIARLIVFLIIYDYIPDLFIYINGTHIHHLNFGIFLLSGVGAYLLLMQPEGDKLKISAVLYGIGLALTFDEFGMWLHLGGSYWQRASWDAITVLAAIFALIAYAPSLKHLRLRQLITTLILAILSIVFFVILVLRLIREK
jgi:hypothetical protein